MKQDVVAPSTAKAEYRSTSVSLHEMIWVRSLLVELHFLEEEPLYCGVIISWQ
jgi:hypothetical protein